MPAKNSSLKVATVQVVLYDVDPGESLPYPAGPEGAHQVANRSDAAARVMLFSKVAVPAVSVYPDTDTIGVWPDDDTEYYFKRGTAIPRTSADASPGGQPGPPPDVCRQLLKTSLTAPQSHKASSALPL